MKALWRSAGFRLSDINDGSGGKSYFIENWDTALRYQSTANELTLSTEQLVNAAKQLTGWISNQIQRRGRTRWPGTH